MAKFLGQFRAERQPIVVLGVDCDKPYEVDKLAARTGGLLQKAEMICGGEALLARLRKVPEIAGRLFPLTPPLEPLFDIMADLHSQGLRIVVLAEGDPLFFGVGTRLAARFSADKLDFRPAISCLQMVCSRLGLSWENIVSVFPHNLGDMCQLDAAINSGKPVCVLLGGAITPAMIAARLMDRGVTWYNLHIFERMGKIGEKHFTPTLEKCAETGFSMKGITMILAPCAAPKTPRPGLYNFRMKGDFPGRRIYSGAALELLRTSPNHIVWELGANYGLFALETCAIMPEGRVIAIEKEPERALDMQQNRLLFGACNMDIRLGEAPGCLEGLPAPDRIFISANAGEECGEDLLSYCAKALKPRGKLVVSRSTDESFTRARRWLETLGWPMEVTRIDAATASGSGKALQPREPVYFLAAQMP